MKNSNGKKILVVGSTGYADSIHGLGEITARTTEFMQNPDKFNLILFTGGEDVHPSIYNDTSPHRICQANIARDHREMVIYERAVKNKVLMTGICRGLQFLNVMDGGKMVHHLDCHGGVTHPMLTHEGEVIRVNSLHHQMILPKKSAIITGVVPHRLSYEYIGADDEFFKYSGNEIEAAIFPEIRSFGVQYHPEIMPPHADGYKYYYDMVKFALSNPWDRFIAEYDTDKIRLRNGLSAIQQAAFA